MYKCPKCHTAQSVGGECVACGAKVIKEKIVKLYTYEDAMAILEDVVDRIVFCKNCRFASHDTNHPKLWLCSNSNWYKTDDDFCSKGMAKDAKEFEK